MGPVLRGRYTHDFGKQTGKIEGVVDSYQRAYLVDFHIGEVEIMTGFPDAQHVQVLQGREACLFQKQVGEVGDRQIYLLGYFTERELAVDVLLHESDGKVGCIYMPSLVFVFDIFSHIFHEPQEVEQA